MTFFQVLPGTLPLDLTEVHTQTFSQLQGLARVHERKTSHLLSQPCHETTDETTVYFGEYEDIGIPW